MKTMEDPKNILIENYENERNELQQKLKLLKGFNKIILKNIV